MLGLSVALRPTVENVLKWKTVAVAACVVIVRYLLAVSREEVREKSRRRWLLIVLG